MTTPRGAHWSVVPSLLASGWLLLVIATLATVSAVPGPPSSPVTPTSVPAASALYEDMPAILVVARR